MTAAAQATGHAGGSAEEAGTAVLDHVDNLLRHLFLTRVPGLSDEAQVGFQPPDDAWRGRVATLTVGGAPAGALNAYLVDLRERRQLRSAEWTTTVADGLAQRHPPTPRLDCHYLLTAWSPAVASAGVEPALDEHHLLYTAIAALFAAAPLNATSVYGAGTPELAALPEVLRDVDLPTVVLPPDGFHALPYFWGTMGSDSRWRAGAYLIVTVPVIMSRQYGGPIVTTRVLQTGLLDGVTGGPGSIQIGGRLLRPDGSPAAAGWLRLETTAGHGLATVGTDVEGRFSFGGLRPGRYLLRARVPGAGEQVQPLAVPAPNGDYDVVVG